VGKFLSSCAAVGLSRIEIDFRQIALGDMDSIDLAWDMDQWKDLVSTVMNINFP
jgi:hypothetical protein